MTDETRDPEIECVRANWDAPPPSADFHERMLIAYDRELGGTCDHGQGADDNRDKQPHEDCDACRGPEIRRQQLLTEEEEEPGGAEDEEERERSANGGSCRFRSGA